VYKLFKNGKRAKAPAIEFFAAEENHRDYFYNKVLPTFTNKMKQSEFEIIRADLPQESAADKTTAQEDRFAKKKALFLAGLVRREEFESPKRALTTGLVLCRASNWNWQWALLESGTSNYIKGLSPSFSKHGDAIQWIHTQISSMQ
tara:strand:+ start:36 stop:473 length:438 start_codon:yes stop_codon:yes gene_type:complete